MKPQEPPEYKGPIPYTPAPPPPYHPRSSHGMSVSGFLITLLVAVLIVAGVFAVAYFFGKQSTATDTTPEAIQSIALQLAWEDLEPLERFQACQTVNREGIGYIHERMERAGVEQISPETVTAFFKEVC